jgi:hypothetical protein
MVISVRGMDGVVVAMTEMPSWTRRRLSDTCLQINQKLPSDHMNISTRQQAIVDSRQIFRVLFTPTNLLLGTLALFLSPDLKVQLRRCSSRATE